MGSNHFSNKEQFAVNPETYAQYGYENTKASLKDAVPDIPIEVAPWSGAGQKCIMKTEGRLS